MHTRRNVFGIILAGLSASKAGAQPAASVVVWKDPNCGCCGGWIEHMRRKGFAVTVIETSEVQKVKVQRGVPGDLESCHTAVIGDYTIEGHVPADAIRQLLAEKPAARGLSVPGMPMGSPGMEGGKPETYDVILFADGSRRPFARFVGGKRV